MLRAIARAKSVILCICALSATLALAATQVPLGSSTTQQPGKDDLGAVASENKICTRIGIDLLKAGGNAADAVSR